MDGGDQYFKNKIIFTQKSPKCHLLDFDGLMKNNINMTSPW